MYYYKSHDEAYRKQSIKDDPRKKKIKSTSTKDTCKKIAERLRNKHCNKKHNFKGYYGTFSDYIDQTNFIKLTNQSRSLESIFWLAVKNNGNKKYGLVNCN